MPCGRAQRDARGGSISTEAAIRNPPFDSRRAIDFFKVIIPCPSGTLIGEEHGGLGEMFVANNPMFLRRAGPARFERRPTIGKCREILVGRRDEAPLVPPYRLRSPNKAMAL